MKLEKEGADVELIAGWSSTELNKKHRETEIREAEQLCNASD